MNNNGYIYVLMNPSLQNMVKIGKTTRTPEERAKFVDEKVTEYKDKFANPYQAASYGYIDDIIEPRNTRFRVIRAFQALQTKKLVNPLKKHSNIPL